MLSDGPQMGGQLDPVRLTELSREVATDLAPRYQVQGLLGTGAFATVWLIRDTADGDLLACKRLQAGPDRAGFFRELKLLFQLAHPRIVSIKNLLESERADYLFLEYCPGGSLRTAMQSAQRSGRRPPLTSAARLLAQMAQGLATAHAQRIVHRDLKPENVLFENQSSMPLEDGNIKLADFGLARLRTATRTAVTAAAKPAVPGEPLGAAAARALPYLRGLGNDASISRSLSGSLARSMPSTLSGSPAYMAPEQFSGEFEPASDMYALGVLLFEMLHGELPFLGSTGASLAGRHLHEPPRVSAELPEAWRSFLHALLHKSPGQRPTGAETATWAEAIAQASAASWASDSGRTKASPPPSVPDKVDRAAADSDAEQASRSTLSTAGSSETTQAPASVQGIPVVTAPTNLSYTDLASIVRRSGLVASHKLDEVLAQISQGAGQASIDASLLASRLIESSLVTRWQTQHLIKGRCQGFFLGQYKLMSAIGTGGMGSVYLAEHVLMRRKVAIKVLASSKADMATIDRFLVECRAISALDHPNIVRAFDFQRAEKFHYLVMEYVPGENLQTIVERGGPVPPNTAAEWIRQAALGLAHAHAAGIVHRDIKPSNLSLDPKGVIKLLDLGLARFDISEDASLTAQHSVLGTVDYLSPEQALDSHEVDHLTDLYSLGGTLYYLLTGQVPFPSGSPMQRLMAHQSLEPTSIRELQPDVAGELVRICERMMAKIPAERFPTAAAVAEALGTYLAGRATPAESPMEAEAPSDPLPADMPHVAEVPQAEPIFASHVVAPSQPPLAKPILSEVDRLLLRGSASYMREQGLDTDPLLAWWAQEREAEEDLTRFLIRQQLLMKGAEKVLQVAVRGYVQIQPAAIWARDTADKLSRRG